MMHHIAAVSPEDIDMILILALYLLSILSILVILMCMFPQLLSKIEKFLDAHVIRNHYN